MPEVLSQFGDRVSVKGFNTLLVDYVRSQNTRFILRGLRTMTDFDYEFQMAEMNQSLDPGIEYVFLPTNKECSFISSTLVREIASLGGNIAGVRRWSLRPHRARRPRQGARSHRCQEGARFGGRGQDVHFWTPWRQGQ